MAQSSSKRARNAELRETGYALLEALTQKVRVLTVEQAAEGWLKGDTDTANEVLAKLCDDGVVERRNVFAHPIIDVFPNDKPAAHWWPGCRAPTRQDVAALARYFKGRWRKDDQVFTVFVATREGANHVGSYINDPPDSVQWTHDIHLTEVYLWLMRLNTEEQMRHIIGEGALPKLGKEIYPRMHKELGVRPREDCRIKDPDLFVINERGQAEAVIEFAGAYDEEHIWQLHEHCSGRAYQLMKKRFPGRRDRLYSDAEGTEYVLL